MKGDEISFEAKRDLLIVHFGESYLKKHKRERMIYACSNRMRELSRLLICYRKRTEDPRVTFKEILHPKNFDNVLSAARDIVGFDPVKKTFKSSSLAMHLGTSLKLACDELTHLILKESYGFKCKSEDDIPIWLRTVKNFKKLIESRWNSELASLANKDLQEKRWNKPLLLPLVSDIKIFRDDCLKIADDCSKIFSEKRDDIETYKLLVKCSLALLIVFNRRRIGDIQFLKIADYQRDQRSNCIGDFENALTETEKMLTTKYKRVLNSGKGSRAVVILVPRILQNYVEILLNNRTKYLPPENDYVFAIPGSKIPWGKGDIAIRSLTSQMKLENANAITSNKLRKHIATVVQILNLSKDEAKQFSQFMGHTEKTHQEFYELPVDIYQTAKVSKLLLLMEKGQIPVEYKGKSLAEINFDAHSEYPEENDADDDETMETTNQKHVSLEDIIEKPESSNAYTASKTHKKIVSSADSDSDNSVKTPNENSLYVSGAADAERDFEDFSIKPIQKNKKSRKTIMKRGWTATELGLLEKEFALYIKNKTYPSGEKIKEFIHKANLNRTVTVIKSKLQHLIKLKKGE